MSAFVRPTRPADVPGIHALIQGVFDEYGLTFDPYGFDTHLLNPGEYFRTRGGEFWVVEDVDGRIVATAGLRMGPEVALPSAAVHRSAVAPAVDAARLEHAYRKPRPAELKSLYVAPRLRRKGWGRRLVSLAIEHARKADCTHFVAWSDSLFTAAHALYRSMGFTQIGRRLLHDADNSIEIGFELALAPPDAE
ncbi:MAG: GNAT family N-acetyltransferase [Planctomycetota bacterium]|nr:MAG: GNAT family N-acetyltransferase [Planctomycetota bacterium]